MKITEIKTYNIHNQMKNHDRFIDPSLLPQPLEIFTDSDFRFSWAFNSTTEASIHVRTRKRINYIAIKSDLFTNSNQDFEYSYWFVKEVKAVDSGESLEYDLTLDVTLTFGKHLLQAMDGKTVQIKRWHEDRYIVKNNSLEINKNNIGIIQSDFKVPNVNGQKINYDTIHSNDQRVIGNNIIYLHETDVTSNMNLMIDNKTWMGQWYKYAVITFPIGSFHINKLWKDGDKFKITNWNTIGHTTRNNGGVGIDNLSLLVPISTIKIGSDYHNLNSLSHITNLPKEFVKTIFLSPFSLHSHITGGNRHIGVIKNLYTHTSGNVALYNEYTWDNLIPISNLKVEYTKTYVNYEEFKKNYINTFFTDIKYKMAMVEDKDKVGVVALSYPFSQLDGGSISPINYKLDGNEENTIMIKPKYFNNKSDVIKFITNLKSEVGLWNRHIIKMDMHVKTLSKDIPIDPYNYIKKPFIEITPYPDISGLSIDINMSGYQFYKGKLNTNLNVVTDEGSNYLNNHRHFIDAQRKGLELQKDMNKINAVSDFGNTISSLGMSAISGNILGVVGGGISGIAKVFGHAKKEEIINNEKRKIDAQINDAAAHAPSINMGNGQDISYNRDGRYRSFLTLQTKYPNETLLNNIYNYYNKFGYKTDKFVKVQGKEWYKTRRKFNYLQLDNFKDYYDGSLNVDESIITLIESELKTGIRLWWQPKIEYDNENYEITIDKFIKTLP